MQAFTIPILQLLQGVRPILSSLIAWMLVGKCDLFCHNRRNSIPIISIKDLDLKDLKPLRTNNKEGWKNSTPPNLAKDTFCTEKLRFLLGISLSEVPLQKFGPLAYDNGMTRKLFWIDPYQSVCDTFVETVSGSLVTLRETIFYAFSGGQESDRGTIGGFPVLAARKTGLDIEYELPETHTLRPGDPAWVLIDWPRRYSLMRLHFAAELALELSYRKLPGIQKIGAHISQDKGRIDFGWSESLAPTLPELEAEAQAVIDQNLEIISAFSDENAQRRFWEIPGFARVPCGGTHIKRTGEIGRIRLKRDNIGRGKERIEVYADSLAAK